MSHDRLADRRRDLIAYRLRNDHLVRAVAKTPVATAAGSFDLHVYETTVEPGEHLALVKGDLRAPGPVLVRVHAVNALSEPLSELTAAVVL